TFKGVDQLLAGLESKLYKNLFLIEQRVELSKTDILDTLTEIRELLIQNHNSLFLDLVDKLISKVELFGLYFASLDIRQDSSVHCELLKEIAEKTDALPDNYKELSEEEKIELLLNVKSEVSPT